MGVPQRYVEKTITWDDRWNNVIRYVFFPDEKLKTQMCVPEGTTINQFIENYFIEDAGTDQLLTDEKVRVAYYDSKGVGTGNKNVLNHYKEFDIYVQKPQLYNTTNDRLKSRAKLISERIKFLLLQNQHIQNLRFAYEDEFDLWTKTVGYVRYHLVFSYKTTV